MNNKNFYKSINKAAKITGVDPAVIRANYRANVTGMGKVGQAVIYARTFYDNYRKAAAKAVVEAEA